MLTISERNLAAINAAVKEACNASRSISALKALEMIPGIGLATATAILTVCYPEEYTIIDWRVLEVLDLFPSRLPEDRLIEPNAADWTASE